MEGDQSRTYTYWPTRTQSSRTRYNEHPLTSKVASIPKGSRVYIIPISTSYGDDINAVARPCKDTNEGAFEIKEPFHAVIEDFDGEVLRLRTGNYYCLKISIGDLKSVFLSQ